MDIVSSCVVCAGYTLQTEVIRRDYRDVHHGNDKGHTHILLAIVQSAAYTIGGIISGSHNERDMKLCFKPGIYYTLTVILPVVAQRIGCDGLTVLLLRAASPVLSALLRVLLTRKAGNPYLTKKRWLAVGLASLSTFLASQTCYGSSWWRVLIGVILCLAGTVCGCLLGLEQEKLRGKVSPMSLLIHMQTYGTFLYLPFIGKWSPLLPNIGMWPLISTTLTQIICSWSLTNVTYRKDSIVCQLVLTLRRTICGLIIAWLYGGQITSSQVWSLVLALCGVLLYDL